MSRHSGDSRRGGKIDYRERPVKARAGTVSEEETLDADQPALQSQLEERALRSEIPRWAGESRIQFVFPP